MKTYHLSEHLQFKTSDQIMFRELDKESVLLNLEDESYYTLNRSGTLLWNILRQNQSLRHAYLEFKDYFKLDDSVAANDFNQLINDLVTKSFGSVEDISQ